VGREVLCDRSEKVDHASENQVDTKKFRNAVEGLIELIQP
jgi:hypothetical protein